MNLSSGRWTILVFPACFALVCCGTVRNVGRGSVDLVKRSASATVATVSSIKMPSMPKMPDMPDVSLAGLLPNRGPKVAEVREKDLKEMKTGKELAMAHERESRGFWLFGGPVDFKEPTLPEAGSELDGGLLPPRMP